MNWKRELTLADYVLIAANLVPVIGVWFDGWSAVSVFIVYALETLIVGVMTIMKMLSITFLARPWHDWPANGKVTRQHGLFFVFFFILHFGLFAAIQTALFAQVAGINPPHSGLLHFFLHWYDYLQNDTALMLGIFALGYLARDLLPFIVRKEYRQASLMLVMFMPYGRIFVQQFTVILGSMFLGLGFDKVFIAVFAVIKTCFELFTGFESVLKKAVEGMEKGSGKQ